MSNNDWISKLREQMADYQEPVSDDLWIGISQSLDAQSAKKAKVVKMHRWWVAAASVAILGVGGSYVYQSSRPTADTEQPMMASSVKVQTPQHNQPMERLMAEATGGEAYGGNTMSSRPHGQGSLLAMASEAPTTEGELVSVDQQPECTAMDHTENAEPVGSVEKAAQHAEPVMPLMQKERPRTTERLYAMKEPDSFLEKGQRESSLGCQVQLYAENGVLLADNASGRRDYRMMDAIDDPIDGMGCYAAAAPPITLYKMKDEAKHHAPIAVGVQVGLHASERLSFNTGVVYTRTSSEFARYGTADYDKEQVLHYVGIPLTANYEVWGIKQLHTYVMLGGQVDFNVKNDTKIDDIKQDDVKKDRPQLSGKAALGLQYDVVKQVGLYLEPGVKYYFDNGSEIENTFKDKKWNFNLQLGLRVNL